MEEKTPWTIIIRYFRNEATAEEIAVLKKWLEENPVNRETFNELSALYHLTSEIPEPFSTDKQMAWRKIDQRIKAVPKSGTLSVRRFYYYAASVAVLVICFSVYLILSFSYNRRSLDGQFTEIIVPAGQKSKIVLPDSSSVWLNSGSSLKYSSGFNLKERIVTLKGEGFFEVRKDKIKKFRVRSGILDVVVYGTSFNIKNYDNDDFQEITVARGTVGLWNNGKEIRKMEQGDQALLDESTKKIAFQKGQPEVVAAWKNNELVFNNTPFEEVIKYLERWYGVTITFDAAMKQRHNYTFRIKTETCREMLDLMKIITPITYEINGKEIRIKYDR